MAQFYELSCDGRSGRGCHKLAGLYEKGTGVAKDPAKATALLKKSCERGFEEACNSLKTAAAR